MSRTQGDPQAISRGGPSGLAAVQVSRRAPDAAQENLHARVLRRGQDQPDSALHLESIFSDRYLTTVGVKIDKKVVSVDGRGSVTLVLWDLYGEDEFQKMRMSYLRGASGYLLVADGTRPASLEKALSIQQEAEKILGTTPFVVALNKCDLTDDWGIAAEREAELGGSASKRCPDHTKRRAKASSSRFNR